MQTKEPVKKPGSGAAGTPPSLAQAAEAEAGDDPGAKEGRGGWEVEHSPASMALAEGRPGVRAARIGGGCCFCLGFLLRRSAYVGPCFGSSRWPFCVGQ